MFHDSSLVAPLIDTERQTDRHTGAPIKGFYTVRNCVNKKTRSSKIETY